MASTRRIRLVSPSIGILYTLFQHYPYVKPLCQVSTGAMLGLREFTCLTGFSFYNVERLNVRPVKAVQVHYTQAGGITGHVMLLCMLLIYTTSHHRIRQQSFETFWYTHHLFVPFFLSFYTHATGCFVRDTTDPVSPLAGKPFWDHCLGWEGWRWEIISGGLYLLERLYREVRARRATEITKVIRHPHSKFADTVLCS